MSGADPDPTGGSGNGRASESGGGPTAHNVPVVVGSLVLGVFLGGVGAGVAFPTLPTLGSLLGISPFVVGLILSTNRFTRLVTNTPAGEVIDRIGTRRPMIVGFVLQGIAPFGYALGLHAARVPLLDAAGVFIAARAVWGFGSAFVFVGGFGMVTHITSRENRGRWVGYFRGGQSLGFPTGLVAGGVLTDLYGYEVAFVGSGVAAMSAAVVAAAILPEVSPSVGGGAGLRAIPRLVRADSRILAIGTVNFTVRFLFAGVLLSTVVLYAEANGIGIGGFSAVGASGLIMAVSVVCSSAATLASGRLSDAIDDRALVTLPAFVLLGIGFGALAVRPTLAVTVAGVAAIGIGVGGTNPPLFAFLGDLTAGGDVGKMGGVYNTFGDLGSTLGPVVAIPVASRIGYRAGYLVCAGLVAAVGLLVVYTLIGTPAAAGPTPEPND